MSSANEGSWERAAAIFPDPRILHLPDPECPDTLFNLYKAPIFGLVTFGGGPICMNRIRKRPWYAGIHITIASAIGGAVACYYIRKMLVRYYSFRDQIHKHYIQLHPEDFPVPEKKLIADQWELWTPIR